MHVITTEQMKKAKVNNLCTVYGKWLVLVLMVKIVKKGPQLGGEGQWSLDRHCYWVCLFLS